MRNSNTLIVALSLGLALSANAGPAASKDSISLSINGQMEEIYKNAQGEMVKRLVPITKIVPGDEVVYTITYQNKGTQPADKVAISDPIPKEVAYRDGSAFGAGSEIEFSVDGGKTWGKPEALKVAGADGKPRAATGSDYTHIRWTLLNKVAPGQQGFVRFRAVIR
jgi:uncharacterized repeat protein (TIGR01451 family)